MSGPSDTTVVAHQAATALRKLAHLTRPAITDLTTSDLHDLTATLTDLMAALPQLLTQLAGYPTAQEARAALTHASRIAAELVAALDTTHQTLDNTVENIRNQP